MPTFSGNIRRSIAGLLGVVVLSALWATGLARISEKPTAVALLTDAGTQLVNPLLISNGSGITQGTYQQLEREAAAHPSQSVQILFIKPPILGRDIASKSYSQALQVIFGKVAGAYYAGGPGAAFSLPAQLQSVVGSFTPFTQLKTPLPGLPQSPLPQLPSFVTPLLTHVGFTPTTLTADGHNSVVTLSLWLWLAGGVLGLIVVIVGAGWARLSTLAWSVFHASWHITLLLMIAAYLVSRNPTQAAPYRNVLGLVGGAFFPLYAAATVAGLCGVAVCFVATRLIRQPAKQTGPEVMAQAVMAQAMRTPGYPAYPPYPPFPPSGQPGYPAPVPGESVAALPAGYTPPPQQSQPTSFPTPLAPDDGSTS